MHYITCTYPVQYTHATGVLQRLLIYNDDGTTALLTKRKLAHKQAAISSVHGTTPARTRLFEHLISNGGNVGVSV